MEFGLWLPVYGGWLRLAEERQLSLYAACRGAAQCAEANGFDYLYASENYLNCIYGPRHPVADVWVFLSAIATATNGISLVGGLKPGFVSPFVMAHMVASLDWVSGGRASLNVVCGWWKKEFEYCGVDMLDHDSRYRRATEYVRCLKGLWTQSPFSFRGSYYELDDVVLAARILDRPHPSFWVSGHSDDAIELASTEADVLFLNGMPLSQLSDLAARAKRAAARRGRTLRIALNAFVLLADTDAAAYARREIFVERRDRDLIRSFRTAMDESGATVWADLREHEMVDSNAGFDAGLLGSPATISARIDDLAAAGVDILMCQFQDTEDELPRFVEQVCPLLHDRTVMDTG